MNRFLLGLIPLTLLTAIGWADDSARREAERILHLKQNQKLIDVLVHRGLDLAGEDDLLKRANHLTGLADDVAKEIRVAAQQNERQRVRELGDHLKAIFADGVAVTLTAASTNAAPGSSLDQKMKEVREHTANTVRDLEKLVPSLEADTQRELKGALDAARAGRKEVEFAGRSVIR